MGWQAKLNNQRGLPMRKGLDIISNYDGSECFNRFMEIMTEKKYKYLLIPPMRKENIDSPGVYFLVLGKSIVYVGQSKTGVRTRINGHMKKEFDFIFYFKFPNISKHDIDEIEIYFIRALKPKYNKYLYDSAIRRLN